VVGKIKETTVDGWSVDIESPYEALLKASDALGRPHRRQKDDLTSLLKVGDHIVAKIIY
jgi:exosome complex component RRP4